MLDFQHTIKTNQRTVRGGGSSHDGSLRAAKMLYDERSAAFDETRINDLAFRPEPSQHLWKKPFKRDWLSFVIWPRAETSMEKKWTIRSRDKSATRGAYFSDLYWWLREIFESHGHVNSKTITSKEVSLKTKISGLSAVTSMCGGTVPPFGAWWPGMSEKSVIPFFRRGWTTEIMELRTELWRHVRRPWFNAVELFLFF